MNTATEAFGGAPYGPAIIVRGVPNWKSMRGEDACGHNHRGLRWSSLWGHGPREGRANMGAVTQAIPAAGAFGGGPYGATVLARGVPKWGSMRGGNACEHSHWGLPWSFLWGHDPREGCAKHGGSMRGGDA